MTDFRMPSLGADMEAGTLVEWLVKPGDKVRRGDVVAVVETQKGAIEIEIFNDGVLSELVMPVGSRVPVGTVLARTQWCHRRRAAVTESGGAPTTFTASSSAGGRRGTPGASSSHYAGAPSHFASSTTPRRGARHRHRAIERHWTRRRDHRRRC